MADIVKLDSVSKIAEMFDPSVMMTAIEEYDKYLMASNGRIEEYASIQMTRIEDGQPSEERTYEQWQQYFVNADGEVWFTPYKCECDDCRFRKRKCKHLALTLLFKRFLTRDAAIERATTIEIPLTELETTDE